MYRVLFRDAHINEVIARWLNSRPASKVVVVDPAFGKAEPGSLPPFSQALLTMAGSNPARLQVVNVRAAKGIPDLFDLGDTNWISVLRTRP